MEPPWGRWGWQGRPARSTRQSPRTASARSGSSPMRAKRLVERERRRQRPMIDPDLGLAERMFDELSAKTRRGKGIVRDTYGAGEQAAHDILRHAARDCGLEVHVDAAGNSYATLPGRDRGAPAILMGSHLDSVPQGGNYDGAAGVVAGMAVLAGCRKAGWTPAFDIAVMGIRAEEAAWFDASYVGSYAAFGRLAPEILHVRRSDSGRSLAEHMADAGCDGAAGRSRG